MFGTESQLQAILTAHPELFLISIPWKGLSRVSGEGRQTDMRHRVEWVVMAGELGDNPHIRQLRHSAAAYRAGSQDLATLQAYLEAVEMALEGDVPRKIHEVVRRTAEEIEYVRFAVNEGRERDEVERALQKLEAVLARHGAL